MRTSAARRIAERGGIGNARNANPLRSFDPEEATIPGLIPLDQICDDFVCKSSPAVESSLRQIATDICAIREDKRSVNPFAVDVKYDDGERKFEGREGFANHTYIKDNVDDAAAAVTEMRMGDLDEGDHRVEAPGAKQRRRVGCGGDDDAETEPHHGQGDGGAERWDPAGSDAGAAAGAGVVAESDGAAQEHRRRRRGLGKSIEETLGSTDDNEMKDVYVDLNDPMKFFTNNNTPQDDYLQIALFLAAIYLVVKLLEAAQSIPKDIAFCETRRDDATTKREIRPKHRSVLRNIEWGAVKSTRRPVAINLRRRALVASVTLPFFGVSSAPGSQPEAPPPPPLLFSASPRPSLLASPPPRKSSSSSAAL